MVRLLDSILGEAGTMRSPKSRSVGLRPPAWPLDKQGYSTCPYHDRNPLPKLKRVQLVSSLSPIRQDAIKEFVETCGMVRLCQVTQFVENDVVDV